ncbi:hypothetical protein JI735_32935 [Paenibacillus sonchi]|uniref:GAPS4 PD-(D/E)XK nuclease domain-containing protein n=1 Tax=Paenibacillus sonchi TaxID=373687 RepID=A0A974SD83_9BACL|nr:hypothetical protein [Paenibacillus sonchi]QQZ61134.1 hypothetical protein JI735_32935 [Paenibacillus sonchi]
MSEEQQYQGDRWTIQSKTILQNLGWTQVGDSNFDISCVNKTAHKTKTRDRVNPHGIDLVFSFYDPYSKKDIGLIVESKHRKWDGINITQIEEFVKQLQMTIECAGSSEVLQQLECPTVRTGLLMIWCNEPELFEENKYREYLKRLRLTAKRSNPVTIYVASNTEILKWCSLIQKMNVLRSNSDTTEFKFFYPSDTYSGGKSSPTRRDHVNIVHLFSSYIFAKSKEKKVFRGISLLSEVSHVFFFTAPTLEELNFMYSCIQPFQLEDATELRIHLYNDDTIFRPQIEQFIRSKRNELSQQESDLEVNIDYMIKLANVPEEYNK